MAPKKNEAIPVRRGAPRKANAMSAKLVVLATPEEREAWEEHAARLGMGASTWARLQLREAMKAASAKKTAS